jgi:hypothetical protein
MKIHTKLNDDLPCGTLYDGTWIIIYKLQFQVVSLLNQTSQITEVGASALMQGLAMVILFFIYRRLSPDIGTYIY